MNQKKFAGLLFLEAVLCLLLFGAPLTMAKIFSSSMAFPFELLGLLFRYLSLSGITGNIIALLLYAATSLIPLFGLLIMVRKRKLVVEDLLLFVLSGLLFFILYWFINPGDLHLHLGGSIPDVMGKTLAGGTFYSILCAYVVIRLLRSFFATKKGDLHRHLTILLYALNIALVFVAFGSLFGGYITNLASLKSGNTDPGQQLFLSYVFLFFQYLLQAMPYILNVLVVFAALELLGRMKEKRHSDQVVAAADKLSKIAAGSLILITTLNGAFNLMQLIFARSIRSINNVVPIPLFSIAFVLAAVILAQYMKENKQLQEDNDMFI